MAICNWFLVVVTVECFIIGAFGRNNENWKSEVLDDEDVMDVSDFSIYYDIKTNQTIKRMLPRPWYTKGWMLRLPFQAGPCECEALMCTCCAGLKIDRYEFNRQACTVLTYEPSEALLNMEMTMNGENVFKDSFSAKNPPPFCLPIPVPYLPPGFVDMCVRLFDITLVDSTLHVCMDWDTRIDKAPVLVLHYDCMDMRLDGISLSKPSNSSTTTASPASQPAPSQPEQVDADIFDPVFENDTMTTSPYPFNNSVKYI